MREQETVHREEKEKMRGDYEEQRQKMQESYEHKIGEQEQKWEEERLRYQEQMVQIDQSTNDQKTHYQ